MRRTLTTAVAHSALVLALVAGPTILHAQATGSGGTAMAAPALSSVKAYFDRARRLGFPADGQAAPYILRALFTTRASNGHVLTGSYTDTWLSDSQWRREAVLGKSRFVRTRNGKKRYRLDDGPDASLLQFVFTAMEPIPDSAAIRESDWKIEPGQPDGTTKISRGTAGPDGTPGREGFEAYWFDAQGQLVKTHLNSLETTRSNFEDYNGVHLARRVEVTLGGQVAMRIDVAACTPAGTVEPRIFTLRGHEWSDRYTEEMR